MVDLTPEETTDLIEAQAETARGEFATDTDVQAVLSNASRLALHSDEG